MEKLLSKNIHSVNWNRLNPKSESADDPPDLCFINYEQICRGA